MESTTDIERSRRAAWSHAEASLICESEGDARSAQRLKDEANRRLDFVNESEAES